MNVKEEQLNFHCRLSGKFGFFGVVLGFFGGGVCFLGVWVGVFLVRNNVM